MSGKSWRHPHTLKCQKCLRKPVYTTDRIVRDRHARAAMLGIETTGRVGPTRGRYNRPTVEVRHTPCGHTWFTTHDSVNARAR